MPGDVANDAALLSALVANAADASGFRIVGSRVTFAWFSLTLSQAGPLWQWDVANGRCS